MDIVCKNGRHFNNIEAARACAQYHSGGCGQCEETNWLPVRGNIYATGKPEPEITERDDSAQPSEDKNENQCPSQLHRTRMFPCPRCCYSESISETGYYFKTTTFWLCRYPNVVNWAMLQPEDILLEEAQLRPQGLSEKPTERPIKQQAELNKERLTQELGRDVTEEDSRNQTGINIPSKSQNGSRQGYNCGVCGKWFGSSKEAWSHVYAAHQAETKLRHIESLVKESSPTSHSVAGSEWKKTDAKQRWERWRRGLREHKDRTVFEEMLRLLSRLLNRKK